jgi:hypothetical protein
MAVWTAATTLDRSLVRRTSLFEVDPSISYHLEPETVCMSAPRDSPSFYENPATGFEADPPGNGRNRDSSPRYMRSGDQSTTRQCWFGRTLIHGETTADAIPPAEESLKRLHRSGWSCGEAGFTHPDGRYVHQVDALKGDQPIRAEGATPAEAWWRAVEAAAAVGMLAGSPRSEPGGGPRGERRPTIATSIALS